MSFERRLITVQRTFETVTKSNKVRHVPILDPLLVVLRAWRDEGCHDEIVFRNKRGNMQLKRSRVATRTFYRVLDLAGLPRIRLHDLRVCQ